MIQDTIIGMIPSPLISDEVTIRFANYTPTDEIATHHTSTQHGQVFLDYPTNYSSPNTGVDVGVVLGVILVALIMISQVWVVRQLAQRLFPLAG
jgi:hypothetical protein